MAQFNPNEWIAVFRAGDYGWKGKFTAEDVQDMADQYDPQYRKAPVTLGHPPWPDIAGEVPAHGWVSKLKAAAGVLYAKFEELSSDFIAGVEAGKYKGRSISVRHKRFTDSGVPELWHVAFLGGSTPHVVGLLPTFSASDVDPDKIMWLTYADSDSPQSEISSKGEDTAQLNDDPINPRSDNSKSGDKNMSEDKLKDLEARLAAQEEKLTELSKRPDMTTEELAQLKAQADKAAELQGQIEERNKSDAAKEVAALFANIPKAVATDNLQAAMLHFKQNDAEHYAVVAQLLETIKGKFAYVFQEHAPETVELHANGGASERAYIDKDGLGPSEYSTKLDRKARELQKADPQLDYRDAVEQAATMIPREGGEV